jgi:formylmethanofuran dehydrogenase subunit E
MISLSDLIAQCATRHSHLCPRQILGLRMALAGGSALGLDLPRQDKEMLVIAETDGCFVSGLEVAAGVAVGHRTLRIVDYGKIAATFANTSTGQAVRIAPRPDVRLHAQEYAPGEKRHYFAQLYGYQRMPDDVLFSITPVVLAPPVESLVSRAGVRVNCCVCGEEIINEREVVREGKVYCRACLGQKYYQSVLATCAKEIGIP